VRPTLAVQKKRKMRVAAALTCGLAAGAAAMADDWVEMPNGMSFHRECVHHHDGDFTVHDVGAGRSRLTTASGVIDQEPCPYPPRKKTLDANASTSYYSSWVAYGVAVTNTGDTYTSMNSSWTVPPDPKSRGPTDLSSIYLFNGLEDGGGHSGDSSLILQPVLSYGKSGCVLDPFAKWNMLSFLVNGAGRAHCGKKIPVKTGDVVVGTMTDKGNNSWDVVSKANGEVSTYTANLDQSVNIDAAYATLEGMIIYNCNTFPGGGGSTKFSGNQLSTRSGKGHGKWNSIIKHDECGQHVEFGTDEVTVFY